MFRKMIEEAVQKAVAAEVKPLITRLKSVERKLNVTPTSGDDQRPKAGEGEHSDLKPRRRRKRAKQSAHARKGHYRRVVRSDGTVEHVWIPAYRVGENSK